MERKEIRGYDAVRNAAKDFETYSSDLLGDRDVRTYRQLPLEADPPRHTSFRSAVQPLFLSAAIEPKVGQFEALARKLISELTARGGGEILDHGKLHLRHGHHDELRDALTGLDGERGGASDGCHQERAAPEGIF